MFCRQVQEADQAEQHQDRGGPGAGPHPRLSAPGLRDGPRPQPPGTGKSQKGLFRKSEK